MFACAASAQNEATFSLESLSETVKPETPIPVRAGLYVTQITDVNQKEENFTIVVDVRYEWSEPKLTFDAEEVGAAIRSLSTSDFVSFARESSIPSPVGTFQNLQRRSFDKLSSVFWSSEGNVIHVAETVATLQAPDFDFRQYPFDTQTFYVRLLMANPKSFFVFEDLPEYSGMGSTLGEEEWIVRDVWTEIDTSRGVTGLESSRLSLVFTADRHLIYYWTRIFVPLLLLVTVSWANLFLEEYRRRIDIAGANLLAFIAFNFAVSGDLPRLGYVTFLDALMLAMFASAAVTVAYNVMLRRMAVEHHEERAKRIDWHVTYWGFPAIHILIVLTLWRSFFG
ncbi:MAG: hypothetical protein QNJ03_12295 [Dinoroseobacter sp.]|nr:hypothetical protein [Dinoroseobacter sp.]